jgi:hypothetical protein
VVVDCVQKADHSMVVDGGKQMTKQDRFDEAESKGQARAEHQDDTDQNAISGSTRTKT